MFVPHKKRIFHREEIVQPDDKSIRHIALTQSQVAIVDAEDFEWLNMWNWAAHWNPTVKIFYAVRRIGESKLYGMHSQIIPCSKGNVPDHINGNTLDNRRSNLQELPHSLNLIKQKIRIDNTAASTGIYWDKYRNKWNSRIGKKNLGRFNTFEEASNARSAEIDNLFHGYIYSQV